MRTIGAIAAAILLAACTGTTSDSSTPAATGSPSTQTEAVETTSPADTEPTEVGSPVRVGDWEVTLADVNTDATDQVTGDPPEDANRYVLLTIEGTYQGDTTGDLHMDARWEIITDDGEYDSVNDRCGMLDQPMRDAGETQPDEQVEGQVCMTVPEDQLDSATVRVATIEATPDTATYTLD